MNDPHVVSVHYKLVFGEGMRYEPPATRVTYTLQGFVLSLQDDRVTLWPQAHYSSREEVRAACDPLLDAWQLTIAVDLSFIDVRLKYERTEIEDRAPTSGVVEVQLEGVAACAATGTLRAVGVLTRHVHAPDQTLRVTPDVESLWHRYCGYVKGTEPLLAMAYFVLSVVEALAGGSKSEKRNLAARKFNVERAVLKHIGTLTSERGDRASARKLGASSTERPLAAIERSWLEQAVQQLILQVGRSHSGPSPTTLCMADLPPLP